MTISRRTFMTATSLTAMGAALAACSSDDKEKGGGSSDGKLEKVTYLTVLGNLGRDAYIHAAVKKGYFKEVGIEVDVQYGQAGDSNHNLLIGGKAQFASVDIAGAIIRAGKAAKPEDRDLRIVGVVHQNTLNSVAAFVDKGYTSPRDLAGKKVGAITGAAPRALFPAFARLANIDAASIKWVEATPQNNASLLATDQIDALATQLVTQPQIEKLGKGRKLVNFPYSDVISDLYGITIMTHKNLTEKNPDLVKRFNQAIMRGVKYAVNNTDEIAKVLKETDNTVDVDQASKELAILKPNCIPTDNSPVGTFDEARMARNIALLQGIGLIPSGLTPKDISDTRFLPEKDT